MGNGYLRLLGAAHARVVEFVADGAEWIWERSDKIHEKAEIPKNRWVEVVDFYHASEHLHDTVERCRDRSASDRKKWYEHRCSSSGPGSCSAVPRDRGEDGQAPATPAG